MPTVWLTLVKFIFQWTFGALALLKLLKDKIIYGKNKITEYPKPKCLEGWDTRFVDIGGLKLHYVQTGDDSKPLFLMLHGFPEFWYTWRYQLREFQNDYRCVAIDMRGYNLSDKPEHISDYSIDMLANDVKLVIEKLGYKKAILMAHDWGAIVAWHVSMMFPEFIERLIICNAPHPFAYSLSLEQLFKSWYMFMFQSPHIAEWNIANRDFKMLEAMFHGRTAGLKNRENFTEEDMAAWKHVFSQPGALTPPINYYRALFSYPTIFKRPKLVEPPVLIIWGTADHFIKKQSGKMSVQFCRSAQLYLLEGVSHWVQQDEPEKVNMRIRKFLNMPANSSKL